MTVRTQQGNGTGARVLCKLAETHACLTLDDLAAYTGRPRRYITKAVCKLITSKYVVRREKGCYEITAAGVKAHKAGYTSGPQRSHTGTARPRPNTIRQRVWSLLRMRRRQTTHELIAGARNERDRAPAASVSKFMTCLERAGYVTRLPSRTPGTAPTSNGYLNWLLVKDTGPAVPIFAQDGRSVRDQNTGEAVALKAVQP